MNLALNGLIGMNSDTYLGVDLGGTNARYGLVTAKGEILKKGRFTVRSARGPEPIIRDLIAGLKALLADIPANLHPQGLALGAAGRIKPDQGLVASSPNLPGWEDVPLAGDLHEALALEVRLENDANLYALGEWLAGAGQGLNNLILLTLGTGVGGGLILDGRLWNGAFGTAAEAGHIVVEPEGRPCPCGSRGCLEMIASATAMARTAREWIAQGRPSAYRGRPEDLTSADLAGLARQGDPLAIEVFDRAGWALGLALTGIFNLLGLEGAVIGGGASPSFEFIYPKMFEEFSARVFAVDPGQVRFAPAGLGDDAPLAGAPALFGAGLL